MGALAPPLSTGTTNNALVLNPSGGNVGVGTTAPGAKLHVATDSAVNTTPLSFVNTDGYGIYANSGGINARGNTLDFASRDFNNGSIVARNVMTLRPEGNVGIGTTAPGAALHVVGSVVSYTYSHGYSGGTPTWSIANPLPNGTYLVSITGTDQISYAGIFNYPRFAIGTTQIASLGGIASISFIAATLSVTFNASSAQNVVINFLRLG